MLRSTFLKSAAALVATTGLGLTAFAGGSTANAAGCCCGDNCKCEECGCADGTCTNCNCENCSCEGCKCGDGCGKSAA